MVVLHFSRTKLLEIASLFTRKDAKISSSSEERVEKYINQRGIAPLFLVLFAGLFIFLSVTFLDKWWLKNPNEKTYLATKPNPVVTSQNQEDLLVCSEDDEDDPVECPLANEGDGIDPTQLASAQ